MAEELIIKVDTQGDQQIDALEKKVDKLRSTTNKTTSEMKRLRTDLRDAKSAMLEAEEGTEEFNRALARASEAQRRLREVNDIVKAGVRDVGEVAKNVGSVVSGLAGGFGALTGTMQLLGVENEEVLKGIQRLQAIMSISQGVATFADSIDSLQDLMTGFKANAAINKEVKETIDDSADAARNYGVQAASNARLVTTLNQNQQVFNQTQMQTAVALGGVNSKLDAMITKGEAAAASVNKVDKAVAGFGKNLMKTLGIMAAITIAITAVMAAIEFLIKKINEIPPEVKLKFELEESVLKDTQKAMEEIAKIRQNITLASNKTEIDLIKDKLEQEGIATKEQLKDLNDSKALLNAGFWNDYIEGVKAVATNEYLIRKDIELRLQRELKESRYRQLANEETFIQSVFGGPAKTARKEFEASYKEFELFQKTFYKGGQLALNPVAFDLKVKTPTGGTGGKPASPVIQQLYPYLTQKQIDDYIKDLAQRTNRAIANNFKLGDQRQQGDALLTSLSGISGTLTVDKLDTEYERILAKRAKFIQDERDSFEKQMELYMAYSDALAMISDSIVGIYDARLTAIETYYEAEANLIEQSALNEEEKNRRLAELDQKRYKEQEALFEQQKNWQKAFVFLNLASGLMNVYTRATLPVPLGGVPSPFNWIQAGLETAALIGQSVASIEQINAQTLRAPSGSANRSATPSVSIMNPNKTALTTKEENLNMMQQSVKTNTESIVRVSEINEIQNRVQVREQNSTF